MAKASKPPPKRLARVARTESAKGVAHNSPPSTLSIRLTHPDRVLFPDQGITKRDLANYYAAVADWMLPHVTHRPVVMVRCPSGAHEDCFFQKHPPMGLPAVVDRIEMREKSSAATYVWVHDLEGVLALVQFGTLEIHGWGSRVDDLERPDRIVFDLDPDPSVPWKQVIQAAQQMRKMLDDLELTSFVKTTGGKGLHVVVPLTPKHSWSEVKNFARSLADACVAHQPNQYIATMSKAARHGKIFIDYFRNERGATSVVAYSTRARAGATVSMPISWRELAKLGGPQAFNLHNVPRRLAKLRHDPWEEMAHLRQSIPEEAS